MGSWVDRLSSLCRLLLVARLLGSRWVWLELALEIWPAMWLPEMLEGRVRLRELRSRMTLLG